MNAEDYQGESVYREPIEELCYACSCSPCECDDEDDYGNFYGEDFEP